MATYRAQDIHIEDKTLWAQFLTAWQSGSYTSALAILQNSQLSTKYFGAEIVNFMQDYLVETQQKNDDTFKDDIIVISTSAPSSLTTGDVYFRLKT